MESQNTLNIKKSQMMQSSLHFSSLLVPKSKNVLIYDIITVTIIKIFKYVNNAAISKRRKTP